MTRDGGRGATVCAAVVVGRVDAVGRVVVVLVGRVDGVVPGRVEVVVPGRVAVVVPVRVVVVVPGRVAVVVPGRVEVVVPGRVAVVVPGRVEVVGRELVAGRVGAVVVCCPIVGDRCCAGAGFFAGALLFLSCCPHMNAGNNSRTITQVFPGNLPVRRTNLITTS